MCLTTTTKEFETVTEDLIVWKTMIRNSNGILSSFKYHPYKVRQLYTVPTECILAGMVYPNDNFDYYGIYEGLQAFLNKEDAFTMASYYEESVYKCIIPAGSQILRGTWTPFEKDLDCVASNQIIIKSLVKDYDKSHSKTDI